MLSWIWVPFELSVGALCAVFNRVVFIMLKLKRIREREVGSCQFFPPDPATYRWEGSLNCTCLPQSSRWDHSRSWKDNGRPAKHILVYFSTYINKHTLWGNEKYGKKCPELLEICQNNTEASMKDPFMGQIRKSLRIQTSTRVIYYK